MLAAVILACAALLLPAAPAMASARGQGTMLVSDGISCQGAGNDSAVTIPFSLWFTGFAAGATGTVSAYTQPGGELVATRDVTLDENGQGCLRVTGDAPSGRYKLVYDFGSGTGKQKVIYVTNPRPTQSPVPTPSVTTETATATETVTATETETATTTETVTATDVTPPVTSTETVTSTSTVTSTATETTTITSTATVTPTATTGTGSEGDLVLTPVDPVDPLAPSGAGATGLLPAAALLLAVGLLLVVGATRWSTGTPRRH